MTPIKKYFIAAIVAIVSLLPVQSYAEGEGVGVELSYIRPTPTHEFGFTMKPAPCIALTFRNTNLLRFRWGVSLGFAPFKTTMDVFPVWGYDEKTVFPGEQRFKNNHSYYFYLAPVAEFKFLDKPLSPVVGLEARMNLMTYTTAVTMYGGPQQGTDEDSYNDVSLSFLPKVGVVYDYEDRYSFLLTGGYNKDIFTSRSDEVAPSALFPYITISLTAIYHFP